jgi:hypothetical protein
MISAVAGSSLAAGAGASCGGFARQESDRKYPGKTISLSGMVFFLVY